MNSSDFNRFSVNPVDIDMPRSMFSMDHSVKWSCNVGEVIPFDCIEILPGDSLEIDTSKVIRLQPLVAPIMDEVILDVYWFFVPHRLVWSHWPQFLGENNESAWTPSVEYNIPTLTAPTSTDDEAQIKVKSWDVGTIADYLGVPVGYNLEDVENDDPQKVGTADFKFNALPFRSYALICDQWFRSEAVMDPVHVHIDDSDRTGSNGSDQVTDIELGGRPFIACKFFDFFTSALPQPQRGNPVDIGQLDAMWSPVYTLDPTSTAGQALPYAAGKNPVLGYRSGVHLTNYASNQTQNITANRELASSNDSKLRFSTANYGQTLASTPVFFDNLSAYTSAHNSGITVNDLRMAFAVQRYLEKQARYGSRYQEFIKGFFGVDSPDARLQRTEYLGGSRISLNINQVTQTSATQSGTTPLGDVAGMSITADQHGDFLKSFTEHGLVIGCAVCRYHHSYQDSTHMMFLRKTPFEFYNPTFANLGEVPIYKRQLYGYKSYDYNEEHIVFGYQQVWDEYRYMPSRVCGELRSVYKTPLDMWHLADHYDGLPTLSPDWLREDKSNLDRCLAVTSEVSNQIICDFFIEAKIARVMPMYSIPGLIDHH